MFVKLLANFVEDTSTSLAVVTTSLAFLQIDRGGGCSGNEDGSDGEDGGGETHDYCYIDC